MGGVYWSNTMQEKTLFDIIVWSGLAKSNSEARNSVSSGAISINGNKITDSKYDFLGDFLKNGALLLQKGKKNLRIIRK
jgi:tyrosyl-tRNA synthetase